MGNLSLRCRKREAPALDHSYYPVYIQGARGTNSGCGGSHYAATTDMVQLLQDGAATTSPFLVSEEPARGRELGPTCTQDLDGSSDAKERRRSGREDAEGAGSGGARGVGGRIGFEELEEDATTADGRNGRRTVGGGERRLGLKRPWAPP